MTTRQQVVEEALSWVNTPFAHQGRIKGVGVDCDNFAALVAINSGAIDAVDYPNNYRRREDGSLMLEILERYMTPVGVIEEATLADVVAFHDGKNASVPRHLGVISQTERYLKVVHASERGVRHHRLALELLQNVHSVWRLKGLTSGA
jgi:cell wall-associated NlpC family hydrolase